VIYRPNPRGFEEKALGLSLSDRVKGERYDIVFLNDIFTLAAFDPCEGSRFY